MFQIQFAKIITPTIIVGIGFHGFAMRLYKVSFFLMQSTHNDTAKTNKKAQNTTDKGFV